MDKNTYTGLFLMLVILTASFFIFKPSESEIKQAALKARQDSLARVKSSSANNTKTSILPDSQKVAASGVDAQMVPLENKEFKVDLSSAGANIKRVELLREKKFDGKPLVLLDRDNDLNLQFAYNGKLYNTNTLSFTATTNGNNVVMVAPVDNGQVKFVYTVSGNPNQLGFDIYFEGLNAQAIQNAKLEWKATLHQQENSIENEQRTSSTYYSYGDGDVHHLNLAKAETETLKDGKTDWVGFKQHFFNATLLNNSNAVKGGTVSVAMPAGNGAVKQYAANLALNTPAGNGPAYRFAYYFGTNKYSTLASQKRDLQKQVELGYWPLKYINRFIVLPLFNFLQSLNWNYGLIILVLTLLIKLALSPLTYKSYQSMAKMRVLKPEMDEIKEKVGDSNPTLLQQEYMKLYKKAGVNPLGGCLPMLLQLPFVMAFLFFFPNLFELRGKSFLWMHDLSTYDQFINFGHKLPFLGDHLSLMCLLMTISQLVLAYYNNKTQPTTGANSQMKYIGYIMPVLFLGFLNNYPSGLNYYYFLANIVTFLMQVVIRSMLNDKKIHAAIQINKAKPVVEKQKNGFQKRMEDYMRQQQMNAGKK